MPKDDKILIRGNSKSSDKEEPINETTKTFKEESENSTIIDGAEDEFTSEEETDNLFDIGVFSAPASVPNFHSNIFSTPAHIESNFLVSLMDQNPQIHLSTDCINMLHHICILDIKQTKDANDLLDSVSTIINKIMSDDERLILLKGAFYNLLTSGYSDLDGLLYNTLNQLEYDSVKCIKSLMIYSGIGVQKDCVMAENLMPSSDVLYEMMTSDCDYS